MLAFWQFKGRIAVDRIGPVEVATEAAASEIGHAGLVRRGRRELLKLARA
jgi:hypothetical protein